MRAWLSIGVLIWLMSSCGSEKEPPREPPPAPPPPIAYETTVPSSIEPPTPPRPVSNATIEQVPGYYWDDTFRLNELQSKGTHNSYHISDGRIAEYDFTMPTLTKQLSRDGVRSFEIDLHFEDGEFRVYHLSYDPLTTCPTLRGCLAEIVAWSDANPGHHLITVFFDFRDTYDEEKIINHLDELDRVLKNAVPRERLLVPDDVTQGYPDLETAVMKRGWPTLGETRRKIMFVMWAFDGPQHVYTYGGATLRGRIMFTASVQPGWRHGMILGLDYPLEHYELIRRSVREGYLVRTKADDMPTRGTDYRKQRELALRSGAHWVLTTYPAYDSLPGYKMNIPGGTPSRCNTLIADPSCMSQAIENPALLAQEPSAE